MGAIQNNNLINFVLYTKTLEEFKAEVNAVNSSIIPSNIYFIANAKTIYLDGIYYGDSSTELLALSNRISANETNIAGLVTVIAEPIRVHKTGGSGDNATYQYSTIGPALKYLDEQLELVKELTGDNSIVEQIRSAINDLDSQISSNYTAADGENEAKPTIGHVGIQIVQQNGKLSSVDLVEDDIASASELNSKLRRSLSSPQ